MSLTSEQCELLRLLIDARADGKSMPLRELGAVLGISHQAVHERVKRLRARGLVHGGQYGCAGIAVRGDLVYSASGSIFEAVNWSELGVEHASEILLPDEDAATQGVGDPRGGICSDAVQGNRAVKRQVR